MTREDAAAKALVERSKDKLDPYPFRSVEALASVAIEAADKVLLDDATVERAARALMHSEGWGWVARPSKRSLTMARAALTAAIEGNVE